MVFHIYGNSILRGERKGFREAQSCSWPKARFTMLKAIAANATKTQVAMVLHKTSRPVNCQTAIMAATREIRMQIETTVKTPFRTNC